MNNLFIYIFFLLKKKNQLSFRHFCIILESFGLCNGGPWDLLKFLEQGLRP